MSSQLIRSAYSAALLVVVTIAGAANAQSITPSRGSAAAGEVRGRLVEQGSARALASGSITVRRATDTNAVKGTLPKEDGTFRLEGLQPGRYLLRIRALGHAPYAQTEIAITAEKPVVELGDITLAVVATALEGQQVTAERDEVALAPDRNSYSTKNMTSASGGTAIDVLKNVPSVEVDQNNKVSLRGNENVVVQINGRSSPLKGEQLGTFLAQLPANAVKNVEVATNPSAKNDPEGSAGIINIVLNQEAEVGLSGGTNVGTSTTGMANLSGNIARQSGPLTLFMSGNFYRDSRRMSGTVDRTNLIQPVPAFVQTASGGTQHPLNGGLTLRSEYRFNDKDALSFDAMSFMGRYQSSQASYYTDLDDERSVIGLFDMFNDRKSRYGSQDFTLAFRRTGTQITTFSTELRFSRNDNSDNTNLFGDLHQSDASTPASIPTEHDRSVSGYPSWNLQSDISHPFGANSKIEAGFKGTQRSTSIDFSAAYLDPNTDEYVPNAQRANAFDYTERIGAAYTVLSQKVGKVQGQAGLRLEQASTHLDLPLVGLNLNNSYASAFPSAIVSYNFTDMRQAKLSYSRRISRPNPWQLSPVEYRQDSRNVFHGNPDLRAEYTDALELGLQESRAWGSVQLTPYVRHTLHAVRYIQTVDTAGVSLGTYANLASTLTWGTDFNVTVRAGALTLLTGGSAWRYTSDASNLSGNLSARAFVWSSRANLTWKFSPVTDAQLSGNYRAPYNTEGGSQASSIFMNISGRYKAWGDAGSISVRVADPFNMFKYGYRTRTGSVEEVSVRQFQQRALYISINRTFGQQVKLRPKSGDGDSQPAPGGGVP